MIIKTISYGFTKNLGNYQSERLDMTAELDHDDDPKTVLQTLRLMVQVDLGVIKSTSQGPHQP